MVKILFVAYGGGHIKALIPIIQRIQAEKDFYCEVLGLTTASEVLKQYKVPYKQMLDFADEECLRIGKPFAELYHQEGKGISFDETMAYYGIGYRDLVTDYGDEAAKAMFQKAGRSAFCPVQSLKNILIRIGADAVVATSSPRCEMAALLAGLSMGIPAIRIVQFSGLNSQPLPPGAFYCVMNDLVKQTLIEKGIHSEDITVTGQPAFDELYSLKRQSKCQDTIKKIKKRLGYPLDKKNILWATQKTPDQPRILQALLKIANVHEDILLTIKVHPGENLEQYEELIQQNNCKRNVILKGTELYDLLMITDAVITEFSTVGLEAILLDKPVITINLSGHSKILYTQTPAVTSVYKLEQLECEIEKVLYDQDMSARVAQGRRLFENDGKATERVYDVIRRATQRKK